MAQRHCDVCNGWHSLEDSWPQQCMGHYRKRMSENRIGLQIMKDIEPYKNVVDGRVIGGRRQHKEFLKSNGFVEVGNEVVKHKYQEPPPVAPDIIRAMREHNYN